MKTVMFVCTGNTCRSPMAEAIFNKTIPDNLGHLYCAKSAGIFAQNGAQVSENSVAALKPFDIDISSHRAKQLDLGGDLEGIELFVCMTDTHADHLLSLGIKSEKLMVLQIADPFGCGLDTYTLCAQEIFKKMPEVFGRIGLQNEH
ncbi:MAG: low molecular weight protein arginine phosphatase [bacterium]|nr:low molecular weight protein arginine phosphatase [bacterium]